MRINIQRAPRHHRLPVQAVKTYQVMAPEVSHWRTATCAEVECPAYMQGWRVRLATLTPAQRYAIETSGRRYSLLDLGEGQQWWTFPAGQRCFRSSEHRLPVGRPTLYVVRDGDPWRGNPRGTPPRIHTDPKYWAEDFANHQQLLYERWKRG